MKKIDTPRHINYRRKTKRYGDSLKSETYDKSGFLGEQDDELVIGSEHRAYGSTHRSPTKERIVRCGKKTERRRAREEIERDKGESDE